MYHFSGGVFTREIAVEARVKYAKGLEKYYGAQAIVHRVMEDDCIIARASMYGAAKCHAALGDKIAARFLFGQVKQLTDEYESMYADQGLQ
jgi:hypothetical protein